MPLAHVDTFLGLTADAWTAIGTVATAAVALVAALFAGWQVLVMRGTRREQTRPYVVVDFREHPVSRTIIALVIENIGATPAYDVRLDFSPELESTDDERDDGTRGIYSVAESPLIRDGIPTMPPRRKIVVSFDSAPKRKRAGLPLRYDVTVTLKDSRGNKHTEQYIADMAHMFSLSYTEEQTVHHVARALQGIQQLLTRSTGSKGRLQVDTHDLDRETLDSEVEEFLIGDPSIETLTGPAWLRALAANPYFRGAVNALPPLRRWIRRRLTR